MKKQITIMYGVLGLTIIWLFNCFIQNDILNFISIVTLMYVMFGVAVTIHNHTVRLQQYEKLKKDCADTVAAFIKLHNKTIETSERKDDE